MDTIKKKHAVSTHCGFESRHPSLVDTADGFLETTCCLSSSQNVQQRAKRQYGCINIGIVPVHVLYLEV
jgi:hypothetical protein